MRTWPSRRLIAEAERVRDSPSEPTPPASEEAREVKYCIQGDGLAMANDKTQRSGSNKQAKEAHT